MKQIFLFTALLFVSTIGVSQTVSDAIRYSSLQPGGSARFLGAGGAFGALGADYGVLSTNPAGLAMFRTNELVITPGLRFTNTIAQMPGASNLDWEDSKSNFAFDNVGMVFNSNPRASHWSTVNFGIGFNRQQNFHQSIYYEGTDAGSIMNDWFAEADQVFASGGDESSLYPFGARMAYDASAIYFQDGELSYDFINSPNAAVERTHSVITTGGINEMVFSLAGNYDEKLMIGATVGVPFINYRLDAVYEETDPADNVQYFNDLSYTDYLRTQGVGVNFKMGVIYRMSQMVRLGASFHSPTLMGLTDRFSNTLSYSYTDGTGTVFNEASSPEGTSDYRLRTPWRATGSAAFIIGKLGFISADAELVDYSANKFNFTANVNSSENERFERELNSEIQRNLGQAVNIRIGGELALDVFRIRAGMNLLGKPVEGESGFNTAYTAGVGVRGQSFYLDLGYRLALRDGSVAPYSSATTASLDNKYNDILMTIGFKF
ncbi:MAG: hypothetical protein R2792_07175 [Saprospiraceae bacterium]